MTRYPARAFHDSLDNGRASGELLITALGFQFRSGAHAVDLPFRGASLRVGGAGDRLVFITHEARPGWSVYTDDRSIIRNPLLAAQPDLLAALSAIRRRRAGHWAIAALVCLLLLALPVALILNVDWFAGLAARRVPAAWEEGLGRSVFAQYQVQNTLLEDKPVLARLKVLTDPLTNAVQQPRHPFRFHIAKDSTLNAFALPGGYMVINSELILRARSAAELQGVLAHEMSHVTEQHGLRMVITSAGVLVIAQAVLGDVTGLLATLGSAAPLLLNQRYSRGFESQADDRGLELLQRARIDPRGMVSFFEQVREEERKMREKLRKTTGGRTADVLERVSGFLSTHPATERRIARIRARAEKQQGPFIDQDAEFLALQAQVRDFVAQDQTGEDNDGSKD